MVNLVMIFLAGGAGSIVRFLLARSFTSTGGFPVATLVANILASTILGLLFFAPLNNSVRLWIAVGFCGALSTFSTFSLETVRLAQSGQWGYVILNVLLNMVVCFFIIFVLSKFKVDP